MPRIARWLAVPSLLLSLPALDGCHSAAPDGGLVHVVLQTDWYPQPEMGGFYQAQQSGLYKAAGLDVTINPGGPFVVAEQQVASGAAQFAMGSSDKVLEANSHGLPLVAVGATMQQDPQAVMVHADSPVHALSELNGHTVAVRPGSTWWAYLVKRFALTSVKETPATYSVANFLQDPSYIQQAFVTSEPFFAEKGGAKVRVLPVNATGYQPYRVFYTQSTYLQQHPEVVQKFVTASLQGWHDYLADPAKTNLLLQKLNPSMNPEWEQFSISALKSGHYIEGDGTATSHLGAFTSDRWTTMYKQLVDLGVITHTFDPTTAYTTRFLH